MFERNLSSFIANVYSFLLPEIFRLLLATNDMCFILTYTRATLDRQITVIMR